MQPVAKRAALMGRALDARRKNAAAKYHPHPSHPPRDNRRTEATAIPLQYKTEPDSSSVRRTASDAPLLRQVPDRG